MSLVLYYKVTSYNSQIERCYVMLVISATPCLFGLGRIKIKVFMSESEITPCFSEALPSNTKTNTPTSVVEASDSSHAASMSQLRVFVRRRRNKRPKMTVQLQQKEHLHLPLTHHHKVRIFFHHWLLL